MASRQVFGRPKAQQFGRASKKLSFWFGHGQSDFIMAPTRPTLSVAAKVPESDDLVRTEADLEPRFKGRYGLTGRARAVCPRICRLDVRPIEAPRPLRAEITASPK
jgi:hypothetical protein